MELGPAITRTYLRLAFERLLAVAEGLGDDRVNDRPNGDGTNSVAALVVHCCGLTEFWLGHVVLGRPTERDRDAEFVATATVAELQALVEATLARIDADVDAIAARPGPIENEARVFLPAADGSDADAVLHVLEELFQHLGHAEATADALRR